MWDYYEYTRVYNNKHKNFVMPLIYDEFLVLCWYELHRLHLCNILNILNILQCQRAAIVLSPLNECL